MDRRGAAGGGAVSGEAAAGETLRALLDTIQDVFYRVDREGRLVLISRSAAGELGVATPEALLGRRTAEFWRRPPERQLMLAALRQHGEVRDWEVDLRTADGRDITISTTVRLLRDAAGEEAGYEGIWRNVTERAQAEARLRLSEEKFSKVFQTAPDTMVITRARDGLLLDVNPGFEAATGWPRGEAVGRSTLDLALWVDTAAREAMVAGLRARGEALHQRFRFRRRDGAVRDGIFSARSLSIGAEPCVLFLMQDVSEHRRLEDRQARLEAQLRQSQKLEAVGQVAGGVAHDFNNLLTVQLGALEALRALPQLPEGAAELLGELDQAARAAARLTRQLLAFSRRQVLQVRRVDLNEVLEGFLGMLRRVLREDVRLAFLPSTEPLWLDADVGTLEQVVMNLTVNARDAMPAGGLLTVACHGVTVTEAEAARRPAARAGRWVQLAVSDTGHGMDEATLRRLFEPFFTTKAPGVGTGLGLATAYGIVEQHRGFIEVESRPGAGARFLVHFPAAAPPAPAPRPEAAARPARPGQGELILLVEDDPGVRRAMRGWLERLGYAVEEAADGLEALARWQAGRDRIRLVLTDVVMPRGLSGLELVRRLRAEDPRLPAVVMSGYSADLVASGRPADVGFLAKPCSAETLAEALAGELARAGPAAGR